MGDLQLSDFAPAGYTCLELEIGFGKGWFLLERARSNPNTGFVGLEIRRKWVHLVLERARNRAIPNIQPWLGDAKQALSRVLDQGIFSNVFINFPDPWWKKRHLKRMVIVPELIAEVVRLLTPDGGLFVQTDVDFRADYYRQLLLDTPGLIPVRGNGTIDSNPFTTPSLREIKCEAAGLPIYRLLFKKGEGCERPVKIPPTSLIKGEY